MRATPESPEEPDRERRQLGRYGLATTTRFGPRVTGLWSGDSPNLFAVLGPEVRIENPEVGDYVFRGGHRLWVAPEIPEVTHVPDDFECAVRWTEDELGVVGGADQAGFAKSIELIPDDKRLVVNHRVLWDGDGPIEAAPWAITQLPVGGTAILPLGSTGKGVGPQADRSLVLWPYTRLDDPRIAWRDRAVILETAPGPPMKVGAGPEARRLGYLQDGLLFSKWFDAFPGTSHSDRGATAQIFLNEDFCELETLGPIKTLEPGSSATHREHWEVRECASLEVALEALLGEVPG